ncbi:MAG TPA: TRAP transporter large permease subunit [Burkholderiales bacterium]|nr:TRAP transporter large permease subunit [Burkholderiales bacterium]
MNSVGTLWLFGLTFVICADVAGRYLFDAPIQGAAEVVGFSVVAALFLAFPNTLRVGRFTRVEVLIQRLEARHAGAAALVNALYHLVGAAVFGAIAWGTWPRFETAWSSDEITGTPGVFTFPVWPFFGVIVFGAAATCLEFLIQASQAALRAKRPGWGVAVALAAAGLAGAWIASSGLSNVQIGLACIVLLVLLLYSGMPIGVVMIVVGFAGIWLIRGDPELGVRTLSRSSSEYLKNYFFGVVPLYVLMGLLVSVSDVGRDAFDVARWALRGLRGGLGVATVAANALFASVTGSSIASAAVFTRIATPEMLRFGYTPRFSVGVVAGTSVLGMLIPPSLLLIVYGFIAEESVGALFLAAIVPGLILASLMALAIVLMAVFAPGYVGGQGPQRFEMESVRSAALKLVPIVILIVVVLGGIYGGVFTPTESAAAGAAGALLIALARRKLSWRSLWATMVETGYVTVSVLFLLLAARIFGQMLAMSNLPQQMSAFVAEAQLGLYGFTIAFIVLVLLLGTILDSVSIMVITLPFAVPVVKALGGDLIWFGIIATVAVETGLLTPPFGISCYVVKSTLDDPRITLNQIFAGAAPFVLIMAMMLGLLIFIPELSLVFK